MQLYCWKKVDKFRPLGICTLNNGVKSWDKLLDIVWAQDNEEERYFLNNSFQPAVNLVLEVIVVGMVGQDILQSRTPGKCLFNNVQLTV